MTDTIKRNRNDFDEEDLSDTKKAKIAEELEILKLTTKTGGVYIPPARLRELQAKIKNKSGEAYQRVTWDALKKSINGLVNKVGLKMRFKQANFLR
jgi:pre-mRNA-splicing factor CWC22